MRAFVQWLQATPLSRTIRKIGWVIPMLQTLHILAIGLVLAAVVMIDMRVWGWSRSEPLALRARRCRPLIWAAMGVRTATGIADQVTPRRTLLDLTFQVKMLMMVVAIAATLSGRRAPDAAAKHGTTILGRRWRASWRRRPAWVA